MPFPASLQVPYLLNVALAVTEYLPAFPAAPRPTFALLKKLDHCFSSLLEGKDVRSHEALPGFERGMSKGLTRTDMVRLRSLADETRSLVAVKMSGEADVDTSLFPEDIEAPVSAASAGKRKAGEEFDEDSIRSGPSTLSPKRQRTESPTQSQIESPTVKLEDLGRSPTAGSIARSEDENNGGKSGQFHWAVDEDSDDDQDENNDQIMHDVDNVEPRQVTPSTTGSESNDQHRPPPTARNEYWDVDDEDEELHMSVAKVYEKTIIQLGRTLGETLIDE